MKTLYERMVIGTLYQCLIIHLLGKKQSAKFVGKPQRF